MDFFMRQQFNISFGLSVLFVDLEFGRLPLVNTTKINFFESQYPLWSFFDEFATLNESTPDINPLNFHDVLRLNSMGYMNVLEPGVKWETLTFENKRAVFANFQQTIRRIKPIMIVALGKRTFDVLFLSIPGPWNMARRVDTPMTVGISGVFIRWEDMLDNISSQVFLMRKTAFRSVYDRQIAGIQFREVTQELHRLKIHHEIRHPEHLPVHVREDRIRRVSREFTLFVGPLI